MKDVQKGLFAEDSKSPWILAEFPFGLSNKKRYEIHDNLTTIIKGGGGGGGGDGGVWCSNVKWLVGMTSRCTIYDIYAFPNCDF